MCGRFTLRTNPAKVAEFFGVADFPLFSPRYNIAPTQPVTIVRADAEEQSRRFASVRWGLIPFWAKDPSIGARSINARSETIAEKPTFRAAFKSRRCLIPVDGFYEWKKAGKQKQPHYIHRKDDEPFAFAGLWERWTKGDEPIESCTIITTCANKQLADLHDRMPVILRPVEFETWLDPTVDDKERLSPLLSPSSEKFDVYPVSVYVNKPANDDASCLEAKQPDTLFPMD